MHDFSKILQALESPNSNGILSFVIGFLFMIMVYNITMFYQHKSKVYLYYSLYIVFIILSTLFYISSDFFDLILDPIRPLLFKFVAYFRWVYNSLYFLFAMSFVDLRNISSKYNKIIIYPISLLLIVATVIQITSLIIDDPVLISNVFSRFFIPFLFIHSIIGYYVLFKIEARFKYYLIIGSFMLLVASLVGAAIYYMELLPRENYMRDSILYFGIVAENILFSLGLAHKQKFLLEEQSKLVLAEKENSLKAVIETQEKERARIAQDLHDGVLQQIGGVILQARNLVQGSKDIEKKDAELLIENLVNSNEELRTISHRMMPKSLSELGLIAAITDMLNLSLPYANIKHTFEYFNFDERLDASFEITVYRVAQELVNNIVKHSQANKVSVQLFIANNHLVFMVEDNGVGLSNEKASKGIGLMNMQNRVSSLNGNINFDSEQNKFTMVTVKIPLT